jgi:arylsulfatase A-like enzyme
MNDRALRWVRADTVAPFFLFVNYYDAHEPYLPGAPFDTLFGSTAGRDLSHMRQISAHMASFAHKFAMSAEQREFERLAYEQSIAWLDAEVGKLLDSLRVRDTSSGRPTIVAVTSDHGEQFLENGYFGHGNGLYLPALHVPLLIAGPGVPSTGARRSDVVSTSDLGATLLSLAGVSDTMGFGGTSLFSGVMSDLAVSSIRPARNQDSDYPSFRGKMYSATTSGMHVIRNADGTIEQFQRSQPLSVEDSVRSRSKALGAIDTARSREYDQPDRSSGAAAKR